MRISCLHRSVRRGLFCLMALFLLTGACPAQSTVAGMALPSLPAGTVDAGALPGTQQVTFTLLLAPPADRAAALESFLTALQTPGSPQYRQWLTPGSFATQFGAIADQIASVKSWAAQQGLAIGAVSASGTYVTVTGTAAQVEASLAPALHAMQMGGMRYQANTAVPVLPTAIAANVLAIDGLDTVPAAQTATLRTEAGRVAQSDLLAGVSTVVEANTSRLLSIASAACVEDVDAATASAMHLLLKEAAAEGITTLASSGCNGRGSASYPGGFAEAVSAATSPGITPAISPTLTEVRPGWQDAPGLPLDSFRHEPDLTVSGLQDLESAVLAILAKMPVAADGVPGRLGNMAGALYTMAPEPNLFSQPDGAAAGTWEAPTGLGLTNLTTLIKTFASGTAAAGVTIVPTGPGSSNPYTITYGGNQTYAITVTGQNGAPTDMVNVSLTANGASLYTASVQLAPGPANTSTATFQLSQLASPPAAPQEYSVVATYGGDGTYRSGDTGQTSVYVNPAPITITANAASSSGTLYVGGQYLVAVTLATSAGAPTGSLTITPSSGTAQTIGFPQSAGSNQLTTTFTATVAGTITINVTCTTGGDYTCGAAGSTSVLVNKATPTISAVQITNIAAQTATLSVTVTGSTGAIAPSGTVTFTAANGTVLCTTANSSAISGPVSCQSTNFPGTASGAVTATYVGDANYNSATGTGSYTGALVATTTTLAKIASPVVVNTNVNLVGTIAPASTVSTTPPSGTITFYDNGTQIAQQTVANSQTQYTASVPLTTQGTNQIYVTYSGDTTYATSTSATQNVVVAPASSVVVTIAPSANVTYGNAFTLTATISALPNNGATTLSGSMQINLNGTDSVSQTVGLTNATGTTATAVLALTQALDVGTYVVNLYCKNTNFDCSSFNTTPFSFTVAKTNTSTGVQVIPSTFTAGQSVYATAVVTPAAAVNGTSGVVGGTVTFYDNGTNIGTNSVYLSGGKYIATSAPFTVSTASDNVVAVYNGDGNNNSSTSTGSTTGGGTPSGTGTTVAASTTSALNGAVVTLTATVVATPVAGSTGTGSPAGTVNFYDTVNGTQFLLGTVTLSGTGTNTSVAALQTTALRDGANVVTASFAGSSSFTASASTSNVTVQITDYAVSFTPTSLSLTAGQTGTVATAVNAVNGFNGQVVLGCTAPAGSAIACTFSPATISTSGLSTLTVTTTARTAVISSHTAEAEAGAVGALLLCLLLPAVRRRRLRLLAVALLVVLGSTLGCTNLINPATGSGLGTGTPAGTLVLTITTSGTDGVTTARHPYQISVTVQ